MEIYYSLNVYLYIVYDFLVVAYLNIRPRRLSWHLSSIYTLYFKASMAILL